jgi:tetratricopeptide (TPR) repeat protein
MGKTSYSALFAKAQEAGASRNYAEAEAILTRIVAETDSIPEAWLFLGRARHALGDHDRAVSAFASFLGSRPDDGAGWFFMGRTYLTIGRAREAAACLRSAIDKGRQGAESWALLGFAELRLKRSAKAVASLERAVGLAPRDERIFHAYLNALYVHAIRALSKGEAAEAASMLDFVIGNGMDGPAQRLYRARALRTEGRLAEALAELEAAIGEVPDDASLRLQAATLRFSIGDTEGAMADIERAGLSLPSMQGAPWTAEAIDRWRVLVALKEGDYKTALEAALDRIRSGDADAAIRAVAAQANYELGRFERAAAHYKRAVETDAGSPELRIGLALSLWELGDYPGARSAAKAAAVRGGQKEDTLYVEVICDVKTGGDPSQILPKAQAMLKARPGDPRLMLALGECLYKTGRPDLADAWFVDVLKVWPKHEMTMLYRISAAESLGHDQSSLDRYSEYLSAYPDNAAIRKDYVDALVSASAWSIAAAAIEEGNAYGGSRGYDGMLAVCYRNSGRYQEAAALYRGLLRAEPKNADLLLGLAYSLFKSGAKAVSIELLERGAAFIGKNAEPYLALGVLRARQKESEKAAAAFLRASELAPADPRPLRNLAKLYAKAGIAETAAHFKERAEALDSGQASGKKRKIG